jgi:hypothetical protein
LFNWWKFGQSREAAGKTKNLKCLIAKQGFPLHKTFFKFMTIQQSIKFSTGFWIRAKLYYIYLIFLSTYIHICTYKHRNIYLDKHEVQT